MPTASPGPAPEAAPPHVQDGGGGRRPTGRACASSALAQPRGERQQHAEGEMIPVLVRVAALRAGVEVQRALLAGAPFPTGERRAVLVGSKEQMGRREGCRAQVRLEAQHRDAPANAPGHAPRAGTRRAGSAASAAVRSHSTRAGWPPP